MIHRRHYYKLSTELAQLIGDEHPLVLKAVTNESELKFKQMEIEANQKELQAKDKELEHSKAFSTLTMQNELREAALREEDQRNRLSKLEMLDRVISLRGKIDCLEQYSFRNLSKKDLRKMSSKTRDQKWNEIFNSNPSLFEKLKSCASFQRTDVMGLYRKLSDHISRYLVMSGSESTTLSPHETRIRDKIDEYVKENHIQLEASELKYRFYGLRAALEDYEKRIWETRIDYSYNESDVMDLPIERKHPVPPALMMMYLGYKAIVEDYENGEMDDYIESQNKGE